MMPSVLPLSRILGRSRPGALLLEALLGIAVFSLFLGAVGTTLLLGQEGTFLGGDRIRAAAITGQALEAARAIRDNTFSGLTAGVHGYRVGTSGTWEFSGTQTRSSGGYVTTMTVTELDDDWVRISATTKWKRGYSRSGSVTLTTELTDWRVVQDIGNWSSNSLEGSYVDSGTPLFNDIAVSGNYAYITSETSGGGVGLYIFDISTLNSPARVASSFSLGAAAYEAAILDSTLYVVTDDVNGEVKAYDISTPTTFSSSNLRTSYNLPGNSYGRSLFIDDNTLYVGAAESSAAQRDEFYIFDISDPSAITLLGSFDDTSTNLSVSLSGTAAYLGSSVDTSELRVVSVENPAAPVLDGAIGYNATDTMDGSAVKVVGTSAVLGRLVGSSIEEFVLFDVKKRPVPLPPPGPWYRDMGGSVNGLDVDLTACYAWVATENNSKEMQVVYLRDKNLNEASSYNTTTGVGRGIRYDITRDRAYLLTNKAFLILKPGSGTGPCAL